MTVNGKNVGFLYTVGAYCDYNDYVVANPSVSVATASLYKAEIMSREYAKVHGTDVITVEELRALMVYELKEVLDAVTEAEKAGTKRTVETVATKKNAKTR